MYVYVYMTWIYVRICYICTYVREIVLLWLLFVTFIRVFTWSFEYKKNISTFRWFIYLFIKIFLLHTLFTLDGCSTNSVRYTYEIWRLVHYKFLSEINNFFIIIFFEWLLSVKVLICLDRNYMMICNFSLFIYFFFI